MASCHINLNAGQGLHNRLGRERSGKRRGHNSKLDLLLPKTNDQMSSCQLRKCACTRKRKLDTIKTTCGPRVVCGVR
ncbi:hypothetical protein M378DRAFT_724293 [Amanita muscaria Koide BX008]|uniref:Uncharacterized protein n=1 Tax=Amanita muscaria (strain Koide BX008) TaxID=946122 RepID=A0A0C2WNQ3_AMAMK|nr:hypothetical protein M378DRAFT_724293 [Amanita muscaria Koide BX008]